MNFRLTSMLGFFAFAIAACSNATSWTPDKLVATSNTDLKKTPTATSVRATTLRPAPLSLRYTVRPQDGPGPGGDPIVVRQLSITRQSLSDLPVPIPVAATPTPIPKPTKTPYCKPCVCDDATSNGNSGSTSLGCPLTTTQKPDGTVGGGADTGGSAGYWLNQGTGDGDIYAAMTSSTNLVVPPAAAGAPVGYNSVLAPSIHPANGDCLAVINGYSNDATTSFQTREIMAIYDYCDAGGKYEGAIPVDTTFTSNYIRTFSNGNGTPEYVIEMLKGTDARWHMIIHNENTHTWDQYYSSAPNVSANVANVGERGWAELKVRLLGGTRCPTASSTFGISGIRNHIAGTDWEYPTASSSPNLYSAGSCLQSSTPYFSFAYNYADWGWYATQR